MDNEEFSSRFTQCMESLGLTAYKVVQDTGIDKMAISRVKNQNKILNAKDLASFCSTYNISLDWLLLGRGTMEYEEIEKIKSYCERIVGENNLLREQLGIPKKEKETA